MSSAKSNDSIFCGELLPYKQGGGTDPFAYSCLNCVPGFTACYQQFSTLMYPNESRSFAGTGRCFLYCSTLVASLINPCEAQELSTVIS